MGSDNEYEHQAEWMDSLSYWRDKWAAEREKCTMTGTAKLEISLYTIAGNSQGEIAPHIEDVNGVRLHIHQSNLEKNK